LTIPPVVYMWWAHTDIDSAENMSIDATNAL
jgi:hypothetical protein